MRVLKVAVPSAVLMVGFVLCTATSYGTPAYAKKEGKSCTTCHVKMGSKDLNDTGKCYKEHNHTLTDCKLPEKK
jgi:ferredoxin